jgi:WD40 repeat protein
MRRYSRPPTRAMRPIAALPLLARLLAACLAAASMGAGADPLPTEPLLRIEAGMHTAPINRIAADAQGRFLVSASDDKTARVWSLEDGRPLGVLRVPLAPGQEGRLYAVAVSPDGKVVATGGWTRDGGEDHQVYLFDLGSGRLLRRLGGLPAPILDLAFSPDGTRLAVALARGGLRVFSVADGHLEGADRDYGGASFALAYDPRGRLATSCEDGRLRLYGPDLERIATAVPVPGERPFGLAFNPDGSRLAVGFEGQPRVLVLDGTRLATLFEADVAGLAQGDLSRVAWHADGHVLFAAGSQSAPSGDGTLILGWLGAGRAPRITLAAASDTVTDLLPLPDGRLAYAAADPTWGTLGPAGQRTLEQRPAKLDLRGVFLRELALSADGQVVRFSPADQGPGTLRFSVPERQLATDAPDDGDLAGPRTQAPGLAVEDWEDGPRPTLNGRPLPLKPFETSRSLAIAPDGASFVLGTEWNLRRFDRHGEPLWQVPIPGVAWGVDISGDGRLVLAALGDGTLRWYRLADGAELLALFAHRDGRRWVLWTPSGYYDAAPGGDDLIGWHRNNGPDQAADFFGAARLRESHYRPELMVPLLASADEDRALALANAEVEREPPRVEVAERLPPVISILNPEPGTGFTTPRLTVRYALRSPGSAPVTGVKVLVDGRPLPGYRGLKIKEVEAATRSLELTLPQRDVELSLIAENRYAASEPARLPLTWRGQHDAFTVKPKLYLLAVGVSEYRDPDLRLDLAAKDARDFAALMQGQQGGLYREVVTRVVTDAQASRAGILDGLSWVERQTTSKDVAMVFLAGHGVNDHNGYYYFLPTDVDRERLKSTGVPYSDIKNTLQVLPGKSLFFVDTCHAGNLLGQRRGAADVVSLANDLAAAENGVVVFAASTGRQFSLEDPAWGNGAFTKALLEGIGGKADYTRKGDISVNELDLYLSERVKALTDGRQTPATTRPQTIPDFPVAVVR